MPLGIPLEELVQLNETNPCFNFDGLWTRIELYFYYKKLTVLNL